MSEAPSEPVILAIRGLTVTLPDGRQLFREADLQIASGAFVVLVGPSGSGKSTLLRLIAGLDDEVDLGFDISGDILVDGADRSNAARGTIGLVFQNHALFDELSAVGNVQFAIDHRIDGRPQPREEARDLLKRLHVPLLTKLSDLSGGERQRVAVARTLAMDPSILLFDEPTTGLDPTRAGAVADLIAETHQDAKKTVVVVTHGYAPFMRHGPRLVLLDPLTQTLRDVDEPTIVRYFDRDHPDHRPLPQVADNRSVDSRLGTEWLELPGAVFWNLIVGILDVVGGWFRPKWKLRYFWHYLRMVALGTTAIYVAIAGAMVGFVFVFFSFSQLPYVEVTIPLLTEEFLAATGYSTFRVIIPLMIAVLMAGKCGASIAADVGTRRLTHQFDAMRSFGVQPGHYLYGNIVAALLIGCPLMTLVACAANWYASLTAYVLTSKEAGVAVFQRNFFATVWPVTHAWPRGLGWVALKSAGSGLVIAALAYTIGSRTKTSSVDVSRDVGLTIFWASLGVLMLHACLSFVEF